MKAGGHPCDLLGGLVGNQGHDTGINLLVLTEAQLACDIGSQLRCKASLQKVARQFARLNKLTYEEATCSEHL